MPRQADRYAQDLSIELYASHTWRRVPMQDVSRSGMFLAMTTPLAVGTPVVIAMTIQGERVANPARVTHALSEADACTLSRTPGIGVQFREPLDPAFGEAIETLLRRARTRQPEHSHIVVADAEPRMLERLSAALDGAGFSVATATSGLEAWGLCMRRIPDVVLIDRATPFVDAPMFVERLACDDKLSAVPTIVMTSDAGELAPLLTRGAADVILKPFTMLELIARARRVAQSPRKTERVSLSGSLADVGLAPVLTLIEQQRMTGRIVISNGHAAWVDIVDGKVVDAGWSRGTAHPRTIVMALLDWDKGTFKLTASPTRRQASELVLPITHLLLEQARLRDEASRRTTASA